MSNGDKCKPKHLRRTENINETISEMINIAIEIKQNLSNINNIIPDKEEKLTGITKADNSDALENIEGGLKGLKRILIECKNCVEDI